MRRLDKELILTKKRVFRNLSTSQIGMKVDYPIFINQSLSPNRRILLAKAKELNRELKWKFLWVDKAGRIKMRKHEKASIQVISTPSDLDNLKKFIVNKESLKSQSDLSISGRGEDSTLVRDDSTPVNSVTPH